MPLRFQLYQPKNGLSTVGMPRASAPMLVDPLGAAVQSFAREQMQFGVERYQEQRTGDVNDRISKATSELANLELQLEKDPDFRTANDRFKDQSEAIRQKYLDGVTDQRSVTEFRSRFDRIATASSISVQRAVLQRDRDYNRASLDTSLDTYASSAANAKNAATRELMLQEAQRAIADAQGSNYISAQEAGKHSRAFLGKLDEAMVRRDITTMPDVALAKLTTDQSYAPNLDEVKREILVRAAMTHLDQVKGQADKADKVAIQATQESMIQSLAKGTLRVNDILSSNLPPVGQGSKEHFLDVLRTRSKEASERPIKTVPSVMLDLFERIHLPDGDPRKIVNENQVSDAYLGKRLSFEDMNRLRKEIADARTENGQRLSDTRTTFFNAVKPQLDKSTMVFVDPKGGEAMYRFRNYVMDREAQVRKEGKDPYQLYNPTSPEYVGKSLPAFQRSLEEQVKDMAAAVRGGGATAPTAPVAPVLPPQALAQLREGQMTTFANGQVWTLRQGQPVKVR